MKNIREKITIIYFALSATWLHTAFLPVVFLLLFMSAACDWGNQRDNPYEGWDSQVVSTPVFSIDGGTYDADKEVIISTSTQGAQIFYTIDGSTPSANSEQFVSSIMIQGHGTDITVKAIALKESMIDSEVASENYAINYGTSIVLLSPDNNGRVLGLSLDLEWQAIYDATSYTVEIAYDSSFSLPVPGNPFTVEAPNTSLSVSLPDARTFFWRVRTDPPNREVASITKTFHALDDTIYVYCPYDETLPNDSGRYGNKDFPFQTIDGAIKEAYELGLSNVKIAARASDESNNKPYEETISLRNNLAIMGGYSEDFDEASRNIEDNETIIENVDGGSDVTLDILVSGSPTLLDGLVIRGREAEAVSEDACTVKVLGGSNNLTISNCTMYGADSEQGFSYSMYIVNSELSMTGCKIYAGSAGFGTAVHVNSFGVYASNSTLNMDNMDITGGASRYEASFGVYNDDNGYMVITDSQIDVSDPNSWHSRGIGNYESSTVFISDCTIIAGRSKDGCIGIDNYTYGEVTIEDSYILSGAGDYSCGITNSGTLVISASTVVTGYAPGDAYLQGGNAGIMSQRFTLGHPLETTVNDSIIISGYGKYFSSGVLIDEWASGSNERLGEITNSLIISGPGGIAKSSSRKFFSGGVICEKDNIVSNNTIITCSTNEDANYGIRPMHNSEIINNIVMTLLWDTSPTYGISEYGSDPLKLMNNLVFYDNVAGVATTNWTLYSDFYTGQNIDDPGNPINDLGDDGILNGQDYYELDGVLTNGHDPLSGEEESSGNITLIPASENISHVFSLAPRLVYTYADYDYHGSSTTIIVNDDDVQYFIPTQYIEYCADNVARQITAVDDLTNTITFEPKLEKESMVGPGLPVFLWGTRSEGLDEYTIAGSGKADLDDVVGWSDGDIGADAASIGKR